MMIQFKTRLKPTSSLIDLTPLVDVIFLLLVFFIISSDILPMKSLHIENPRLSRESKPINSQIHVIVDRNETIFVGHQKRMIDLSSLPEALRVELARFKEGNPTIVLSIDRRIDYGTFLRLFSAAQQSGVPVRLAYKSEQEC